MADLCTHCGQPVEVINYALGPKLMHVEPGASFPTVQKGTAWWHCKQRVATLDGSAKVRDGLRQLRALDGEDA